MPADLTLAIEMSNPSCESGVAIGSQARGVLGVEAINAADGRHDDLITAIDRLSQRVRALPRDLGRIAVSIGPGGYTALRISIATTKMLCESLGAACVGIPSARVVARRATPAGPFAVILASKDDTAFATVFDGAGTQLDEGRLIGRADVERLGVSRLIADKFLPADIAEAAATRGLNIEPPRFDPAACLELSFEAESIDPVALAPLYPREPEAVTKWRERKAR